MFNDRMKDFLKNNNNGIQLTAEELPRIVQAYEQKYGIRIIINGETTYGKKQIKQRVQEYNQLLKYMQTDNTKYAAYLIAFLKNGRPRDYKVDPNSYGWGTDKGFKVAIQGFLDTDGYIKNDIDDTLIFKLAEVLDHFPEFKSVVDSKLPNARRVLEALRDDECVDRKEVKKEIALIQESLNEDQVVGYIFTNGCKKSHHHFEVIIITKDKIRRPVDWRLGPDKELYKSDFDCSNSEFIDSRLDDIVDSKVVWMASNYLGEYPRGGAPTAQAGKIECGTLGIVCLTQLLKANHAQLDNFSLSIPLYKKHDNFYDYDEMYNFLVPSPQMLRYSQSSMYNAAIETMILSNNLEEVSIDRKTAMLHVRFTVKPLIMILNETKKTAIAKGDKNIVTECDRLIAALPEFRKRWVEEYKKSSDKRNTMKSEIDGNNKYLSYKTSDLRKKGELTKEEREVFKTELELPSVVEMHPRSNNNVSSAEYTPFNKEMDILTTVNETTVTETKKPSPQKVSITLDASLVGDPESYRDIINSVKYLPPEEHLFYLIELGRKNKLIPLFNNGYELSTTLKSLSDQGKLFLIRTLDDGQLKKIIDFRVTLIDLFKILNAEARQVLIEKLGKDCILNLIKYPSFLTNSIEELQQNGKHEAVSDLLKALGDDPLLAIKIKEIESYSYHAVKGFEQFTPLQGLYTIQSLQKHVEELQAELTTDLNRIVLRFFKPGEASDVVVSMTRDLNGSWIMCCPIGPEPFVATFNDITEVVKKLFEIFAEDNKLANMSTQISVPKHSLTFHQDDWEKKLQEIATLKEQNCFHSLKYDLAPEVQKQLMQHAFTHKDIDLCEKLINTGVVDFYKCDIDLKCEANDKIFNHLCEIQAKYSIGMIKSEIQNTKWEIKVGGVSIPGFAKKIPKTVSLEWAQITAAENVNNNNEHKYHSALVEIMRLRQDAAKQNESALKLFRSQPAKNHYANSKEESILDLKKSCP